MNENLSTSQIQDAAVDWFVRMQDAEVSDRTRTEFSAWLAADPVHERAYSELAGLWNGLDALAPEMQHRQTPVKALSWTRHFQQKGYYWYAAAAVLVIYITSTACLLMTPEMTASYQTDPDNHKTVTLRDGSELILAPDSEVSVVMDETGRRVELRQGSARFAVSQDPERPFDVIAANGRIRVVGTIFNVNLSKQVKVSVSRGAVDVFIDESIAPVRLTYGYSVAYDADGIATAGIRHQLDDWHRIGKSRTDPRYITPSGLLISRLEDTMTVRNNLPGEERTHHRPTLRQRRGRSFATEIIGERLTPLIT